MAELISRFTNEARHVFALAQEYAARHNQNEIGTEHLLVALLEDKSSEASQAVATLGVDPKAVEDLVAREGGSKLNGSNKELELSQEVKDVIQAAILEAQRKNFAYVGTKELLLALVQQDSNAAIAVLNQAGAQPQMFRQTVREMLADDVAGV
ncbi:MAG TPA: Clp protease N-terminal domain-containing protein [Aggregatilineales bacterium]|nr:Clp protease N-terminal domain-containing protein [Aggregatilineales bacterium]